MAARASTKCAAAHTPNDPAVQRRYADAVANSLGWRPEPGRFHLFAVGIDEVIFIRYDSSTGDQHVTMWPPGREFIRQVYQFSQQDGLRGRILFMEEYNIHTARNLVAGVDVWLNNPRRPLEASGTSGMKASLNGIPTASILDGWWAEGYNGANGWALGSSDARAMPEEQQDASDAEALYVTLEQQIVPLFYQRDAQGIPRGWLKVMQEAIRTIAPQFSTRRMLKEYVELWVQAMAKEGAV